MTACFKPLELLLSKTKHETQNEFKPSRETAYIGYKCDVFTRKPHQRWLRKLFFLCKELANLEGTAANKSGCITCLAVALQLEASGQGKPPVKVTGHKECFVDGLRTAHICSGRCTSKDMSQLFSSKQHESARAPRPCPFRSINSCVSITDVLKTLSVFC